MSTWSDLRVQRLGRLMLAAYARGQRDRAIAFMGRQRDVIAQRPAALVRRLELARGLA